MAGVSANRVHGFGRLNLQNLISFPDTSRVQWPAHLYRREAPMTRRRIERLVTLTQAILMAPLAAAAQQLATVYLTGTK
jgi:hypothetical protein